MPEPYTGFVIVRLASTAFGNLVDQVTDLPQLAKQAGAAALLRVLDQYSNCTARRLVVGITPSQVWELEQQATNRGYPPRCSLNAYWRLDARAIGDAPRLVDLLNQVDEVDLAYRQLRGTDPAVDPTDDDHAAKQLHLEEAPKGIDARWAWTHPYGSGSSIGFVDVEQGWFLNHEDLPTVAALPSLSQEMTASSQPHGTAVMGLAVGLDNDVGIIGVAPAPSWVSVSSHVRNGVPNQVADAIASAAFHMNPGDVLLVEWQDFFNRPAEVTPDILTAITDATGKGIIVVECAGNGNDDLDDIPALDRKSPSTFVDSGAIVVGACHSTLDVTSLGHDRWIHPLNPNVGSNFGSRVDCHAFGEDLITAGPTTNPAGVLDPGTGPDDAYRKDFGGTSGAGAVVAGAALVLQGMHIGVTGVPLTPVELREALTTNGTPQTFGPAGNIGVMPNLKAAAVALGLVPDLYLRDHVGDVGDVPSTGALCLSPDVIVVSSPVSAPDASFGEGSGTENVDTLGSDALTGTDAYVYVRMRNRGALAADRVRATVYWSPPAILATPSLWNLIGTSATTVVPADDALVVAPAITWPAAQIPAAGHYCLIAAIDDSLDPAPQLPAAALTWPGFVSLIRNQNNVTWRNINVVDPSAGSDVDAEFLLTGPPTNPQVFSFEITQRLPEYTSVKLVVPGALHQVFFPRAFSAMDIRRAPDQVTLPLPRRPVLSSASVLLEADQVYECRIVVQTQREFAPHHHVTIRQLFEGHEVGRLTWRFVRHAR